MDLTMMARPDIEDVDLVAAAGSGECVGAVHRSLVDRIAEAKLAMRWAKEERMAG